jgi:serine/threonine-protein kinase
MEASARNLPRRLGRYEIVGRLAYGGMAEILLGRLTGPSGFERAIVIKRILPQLTAEPSFVEMFLDEGRLAARVRHPNVVQVQELCQEDGELFLVMEYLEGEAAAGLARRCRVRAKPLDRALATYVVSEAAAGLHVAHELRDPDGASLDIVHRDVSPENVFIGYDGTVKVLDFGIAKARDRTSKTEVGTLKGKFEYMSPEQALGEPLDRRSDVFSLGVVLYELTTGVRPFKRATQVATLRAVTDDDIVLPSSIDPSYPRALEDVCMKALARDRSLRYATAQDMRRGLLEAVREMRGPAMPEETLAALMRELFIDRITEKDEMLASMRRGITPSHVPEADVDIAVELPTVETLMGSEVRTKPFDKSESKSRTVLLLGAMLAVSIVLGAGAFAFATASPDRGAAELTAAPTTQSAPEVVIGIDSDPADAVVYVRGEERGTTPIELRFTKSDEPISVRLEREGYEPILETITPRVDQRLRLVLTEEPEVERARVRRPTMRTGAMAEAPSMAVEAPDDGEGRDREFRRFM